MAATFDDGGALPGNRIVESWQLFLSVVAIARHYPLEGRLVMVNFNVNGT
jgi:hypothetical protein